MKRKDRLPKKQPLYSAGSSELSDEEYLQATLVAVADVWCLDTKVISVQANSSEGDTPLHTACVWGDLRAVRVLLDAGARIDEQGDMNATPLYFAVMSGFQDVADYLISKGANKNIRSDFGDTPFELSKLKGIKLHAHATPER